eukprot:1906381-Prorocentrum_lima.AAC.1
MLRHVAGTWSGRPEGVGGPIRGGQGRGAWAAGGEEVGEVLARDDTSGLLDGICRVHPDGAETKRRQMRGLLWPLAKEGC